MRIRTINTIEVSSICDNECPYCPATEQILKRDCGFMDRETFEKAIDLVYMLARQGSQMELNLFGIGEPTLHPDLVEYVRYARRKLPFSQVLHLNTNGNNMTEGLARDLKDAGISEIDITLHEDHRVAARTIRVLRKAGIVGKLSIDPVVFPNNWAGQVDWLEPEYNAGPCPWLNRGQVMIMSDGSITRCCIDAFATGVMGTVDGSLSDMDVTPFDLCRSCHHENPLKLEKAGGLIHAVG